MVKERTILLGLFVAGLVNVLPWPSAQVANSNDLRGEGQQKMTSGTNKDIQPKKDAAGQREARQESPFACNMLALDAEGRRRHKTVMEEMRTAIKEVKPLPDGYAFRFEAEQSTILLISEFIARERLCCPFFDFDLLVEREGGPLWLRLRGREGVKNFIRAELGIE